MPSLKYASKFDLRMQYIPADALHEAIQAFVVQVLALDKQTRLHYPLIITGKAPTPYIK